MAIRGYTQEVEEAYGRALQLAEEAGELPRRLPVLRSLASFHLSRGELDKAVAVGGELLELAEQQDDPGLQVEGHFVVGSSVAFQGDMATGLDHLDRAIALFDPSRHQPGPLSPRAQLGRRGPHDLGPPPLAASAIQRPPSTGPAKPWIWRGS